MSVFGGMSKGERNRIKVRVRTAKASQAPSHHNVSRPRLIAPPHFQGRRYKLDGPHHTGEFTIRSAVGTTSRLEATTAFAGKHRPFRAVSRVRPHACGLHACGVFGVTLEGKASNHKGARASPRFEDEARRPLCSGSVERPFQ
jgi:hypothetical protein